MKSYPKVKLYKPNNINKYLGDYTKIEIRSSWEMKCAKWCDDNPAVLKWSSETVIIPYYSSSDGKMRRYYMDFYVEFLTTDKTVKKMLIEVKPYAQTMMPKKRGKKKLETYLNEMKTYQVNKDKWDAARKYADKMGWGFTIMTEYELFPDKAAKKARGSK